MWKDTRNLRGNFFCSVVGIVNVLPEKVVETVTVRTFGQVHGWERFRGLFGVF